MAFVYVNYFLSSVSNSLLYAYFSNSNGYVRVGNEKPFLGVLLLTLLIGDLTLDLAESSQIELFQVDM